MVAQRVEGSARGRGGDRRGRRHGRRSRRWPHPIAAPRTPLRAPPPSPCVCAVSNRRGPTGRAHGRPHGRCPPPPGPQEVPIVRGGADAPFPPGWSACDSTKQRAPQGAPGSSQSIGSGWQPNQRKLARRGLALAHPAGSRTGTNQYRRLSAWCLAGRVRRVSVRMQNCVGHGEGQDGGAPPHRWSRPSRSFVKPKRQPISGGSASVSREFPPLSKFSVYCTDRLI